MRHFGQPMMGKRDLALPGHVDPTIVEQEYRAQLAHADQLIDGLVEEREELVEEREELIVENNVLKQRLGIESQQREVRGQGSLL